MTRVRAASVLAIALAGPFAGGGARADTKPEPTGPDAAKADDLFKTAKDELKHGLTADACGHFAESARLAPGVGVTLYLADCYQRVGRTASAWTAFREAEALARTHKDKRADLAHHRAEVLEPKLNHLTIQVTGPAPAAPLEVTCDGRRIARDSWGTPVAIDPGEHVIVAQAGGWSRTYGASIDAKTSATTVTIELPAPETRAAPPARAIATEAPPATASPGPAAPPAPEPAAAASPPPAAEGSGSAHVWLTVSLGAVGVAGLGIGTVYGILATSHRNQSNAGPCDASDYCSPSGLSLRQQALSEATVSTVAFIAGLAAVAGAGAAYFLTAGPSSEPSRTGVTVSPTVTAGGAGALFRGAF